ISARGRAGVPALAHAPNFPCLKTARAICAGYNAGLTHSPATLDLSFAAAKRTRQQRLPHVCLVSWLVSHLRCPHNLIGPPSRRERTILSAARSYPKALLDLLKIARRRSPNIRAVAE